MRRSVKDQHLRKADIRGQLWSFEKHDRHKLCTIPLPLFSLQDEGCSWGGFCMEGSKMLRARLCSVSVLGQRADDWGQVWIGSKSWQPRFGTRGNFHYSRGWVAHAGPPPRPWDSACPFSQQHHSCPTRPDLQGQDFTCHQRNFLALSGCSKISQVPPIKTKVGSLKSKKTLEYHQIQGYILLYCFLCWLFLYKSVPLNASSTSMVQSWTQVFKFEPGGFEPDGNLLNCLKRWLFTLKQFVPWPL